MNCFVTSVSLCGLKEVIKWIKIRLPQLSCFGLLWQSSYFHTRDSSNMWCFAWNVEVHCLAVVSVRIADQISWVRFAPYTSAHPAHSGRAWSDGVMLWLDRSFGISDHCPSAWDFLLTTFANFLKPSYIVRVLNLWNVSYLVYIWKFLMF
jgi:hypothetical protein